MDMLASSSSPLPTALIFLLSSRKCLVTAIALLSLLVLSSHTSGVDPPFLDLDSYPDRYSSAVPAIDILCYIIYVNTFLCATLNVHDSSWTHKPIPWR